MEWQVSFSPIAEKNLKKLDPPIARRILKYLYEVCGNPTAKGKELKYSLEYMWSYRVGDYRIICGLDETNKIIRVAKLGHRKDIYIR